MNKQNFVLHLIPAFQCIITLFWLLCICNVPEIYVALLGILLTL